MVRLVVDALVTHDSGLQAIEDLIESDELPATIQAAYGKLGRLPIAVSEGFFPAWGDDGSLGFPLLLRYHSYFQMPLRWIYVRPAGKRS